MNVAEAAAAVLAREGVEILLAYPLNPLIESAAAIGIKPIIVRQERTGIHMADAISRVTSGRRVGVFCMQAGQAWRTRSVPWRRRSLREFR